jgi:hypothetical protein
MTEVEAKRITALLAAAYPGWKPSEATMQVYERLLRPLAASLAEQAVLEMVRSQREFAPPVGAICYRAARLALERSGEGALSAEEAWAELNDAIRGRGCYRAPSFRNPALARTVAAMNWAEICTNPNLEATRAHFFRLFAAFQEGRIARRLEELSGAAGCAQITDRWAPAPAVQSRGAHPSQEGGQSNGIRR